MSTAKQFDFYSVNAYLAAEALAATRNEFVNGLIRAMAGATWTRNCIFSIVRARKAGFFKKLTRVDCVFGSQGLFVPKHHPPERYWIVEQLAPPSVRKTDIVMTQH